MLVPGGCRGREGDTSSSAGKRVAAKSGCSVPAAPPVLQGSSGRGAQPLGKVYPRWGQTLASDMSSQQSSSGEGAAQPAAPQPQPSTSHSHPVWNPTVAQGWPGSLPSPGVLTSLGLDAIPGARLPPPVGIFSFFSSNTFKEHLRRARASLCPGECLPSAQQKVII